MLVTLVTYRECFRIMNVSFLSTLVNASGSGSCVLALLRRE